MKILKAIGQIMVDDSDDVVNKATIEWVDLKISGLKQTMKLNAAMVNNNDVTFEQRMAAATRYNLDNKLLNAFMEMKEGAKKNNGLYD